MNRLAQWVVEHRLVAWVLAGLVALGAGLAVDLALRDRRESELLLRMGNAAERHSIALMSQTLNGNVMGSVSLLGLSDERIKRETREQMAPNDPGILSTLDSIGRSYDLDGLFAVNRRGIVASSWDNQGKSSTGTDVHFRPYYQMAMQGMQSVYAAVSLARGDRAIYFSAPVFEGSTNGMDAVGAIVARTDLTQVDNLLHGAATISLLLSPQGVVFASNRREWIGFIDVPPTVERLRTIRELKQFGRMFDTRDPQVLPFDVSRSGTEFEGRRYAVASSAVRWNDPFGDWKLILLEDVAGTVPATTRWLFFGSAAALLLLLAGMLFRILRGQHAQLQANLQLTAYARAQQASVERKIAMAGAARQLQLAETPEELASAFLSQAHSLFGALQGTVYLRDGMDGKSMRLAASYAGGASLPAQLAPGEGLLGQCALEAKPRLIDIDLQGFQMIHSGLGASSPHAVLMAPVLLGGTVLGVVEMALLHRPGEGESAAFEELVGLLAMNVQILGRHAAAHGDGGLPLEHVA